MGARVATSHRVAGALLAALIVASSAVAPTASAVALPSDDAEAQASVLGSDLLDLALLGEGLAASGNPSAPAADVSDIDASVLAGLLGVNLPGLTIPVIRSGANNGILDLGPAAAAGVLNAYSVADTDSHAVASAGAVGADGAVNLAATANPATIGQARVDVSALISQLGLGPATTTVIDQLAVELGALASRAEQTAPGAATRDYRLAGGRLTLHSPALAGLAGTVTTTVNGVQGTLNTALGTTGVLGSVVSGVNLDANVLGLARLRVAGGSAGATVNLAPAVAALTTSDLVSTNGLVTLNLGTGSLRVDVARLVKGPGATDLNGLAPNTEVLSTTTINAIVAGVADILNNLDELATTVVTTALQGTSLTVTLPAQLNLLFGIVTTNPTITVSGTLAQFAAGTATVAITGDLLGLPLAPLTAAVTTLLGPVLLTPLSAAVTTLVPAITTPLGTAVAGLASAVLGTISPVFTAVLSQIVRITINEQTQGDLGPQSSTVRALAIDLVPALGPLTELNLGSSTVRAQGAEPPITPVLDASPDPVQAGTTLSVTSSGWVPGSNVSLVARDSAGTQIGSTHLVPADGTGALTDSFALPTTTATGALTVTATSADGTAADTVQVTAAPAPPVLTATPPTVVIGDTVQVATSGWPAGASVSVAYSNSTGAVIATHPLTADGTGSLADSLVVPPGTPLGPLTATATGPGPVTPSGTVTVVAPPAVPAIDATPSTLRAGDQLTVDGTGWPSNATVGLTFTDAGGATFTASATTDGTGAFSVPVTVPVGTATGTLAIAALSGAATAADQVQVAPDPAIAARDDSRYPGETLTVDGSGWAPGTVTITYTDAAGAVLATGTPVADGTGAFSDAVILPSGTALGTLQIAASQGLDTAADSVQVVAAPTLAAAPAIVAPGGTVTATGGDWPAGVAVTFVWRDAAGTVLATHPQTASGTGAVSDTLVVPLGTPEGVLTVVATEPAGGTASAVVSVEQPPVLTASPPSLVAGATVNVTSSGWPAGSTVVVTYTDAAGAQIGAPHPQTANPSGGFGDSLVVPPGTTPGTLTVTAVGPAGRTASDTVTVRPTPTLDASPASVPGGGTVTVVSDGWLPGSAVEVVYTGADGTVLATHPLTAGADGSLPDTFVVPVGTLPGTLTVTATAADGTVVTDTVTVEAPPTLTPSPTTVSAGQTVTVTGAGWPANVAVSVNYRDAGGALIGAPHPATTNAAGAFTDTLVVPGGTPVGAISIDALDGAGRTATAAVTVIVDPTLVASPASVQVGDRAEVTGAGWPGSAPATVTWTDSTGTVVATHSVTTSPTGDLADALDPVAAALGTLTVSATVGTVTRTATLTVAAGPSVAIAETTVVPGAPIAVSGSGWTPSSTVTLVYRGSDGAQIGGARTVATTAGGTFADTLSVPLATPAGALTVTATQGGDTGTDSVTVVRTPTVSGSPSSVQPGDTITVSGGGWPPATTVTVVYTDGTGAVIATHTVTTDATGDLTDTLVVPPGTPVGTLTIAVSEPGGGSATDTVTVAIGPAIAADRETGLSDAIITADGSGWTPGQPVALVVTDASGDVLATQTVVAEADGTFTSVWDLPGIVDPGALTILATAGPDSASDVVQIEARRLVPHDTELAPGDTLPVTTDGWPEGDEVTVVYTDAARRVVSRRVILPDANGWNLHEIVVPIDTAAGVLDITASDEHGAVLSAQVDVSAAGVTGPAAAPGGGRLAFTGADAGGALTGAIGLVLAGLLGLLASRRVRRRSSAGRL